LIHSSFVSIIVLSHVNENDLILFNNQSQGNPAQHIDEHNHAVCAIAMKDCESLVLEKFSNI